MPQGWDPVNHHTKNPTNNNKTYQPSTAQGPEKGRPMLTRIIRLQHRFLCVYLALCIYCGFGGLADADESPPRAMDAGAGDEAVRRSPHVQREDGRGQSRVRVGVAPIICLHTINGNWANALVVLFDNCCLFYSHSTCTHIFIFACLTRAHGSRFDGDVRALSKGVAARHGVIIKFFSRSLLF